MLVFKPKYKKSPVIQRVDVGAPRINVGVKRKADDLINNIQKKGKGIIKC